MMGYKNMADDINTIIFTGKVEDKRDNDVIATTTIYFPMSADVLAEMKGRLPVDYRINFEDNLKANNVRRNDLNVILDRHADDIDMLNDIALTIQNLPMWNRVMLDEYLFLHVHIEHGPQYRPATVVPSPDKLPANIKPYTDKLAMRYIETRIFVYTREDGCVIFIRSPTIRPCYK